MSTTEEERPAVTIEDYTHPEWCDLSRCEPTQGIHVAAEGLHYSTGTRWGVQSDEADFTVQLVLCDDYLDGKNGGVTRLRVTLQNWATQTDTSAMATADAWVDPDDARMLAAILTRHADLADRANKFPIDIPASEARHRP